MSCLYQIYLTVVLMFWIQTTQSTPVFQEFSIQKGFEVKLQPYQLKPFSIFKEKWSPFGRFGVRGGIQKRDLPPSPSMSPAPVFELVDEGRLIINRREEDKELSVTATNPVLEHFKPLSSNLIRIPLMESVSPSTAGLYTSINRNILGNNTPEKPGQPIGVEIYGELPPRPVGPVPRPAAVIFPQPVSPVIIQSVSPVPIRPVSLEPIILPTSPRSIEPIIPMPVQPANPFVVQPISPMPLQLFNSITEKPVNSISVRPVGLVPELGQLATSPIPIITPPLPSSNVPLSEIPPTDGPLVRGSKLALYLGNVFMQLVSQFLTNARLKISQFKSSSPVFINN